MQVRVLSWAHGNKIAADYQSVAIFHLPLCCNSIALPYGQASEYPHATATSAFDKFVEGGGGCMRSPATAFKSVRIRAAPCSVVVRPIRERSASRKTPCHSNPEYFDAKSIKPEKFRRTGKFRVGKNREKGIFQQSEGPENLYNIRNCSYTKYLLSNICK